MQRVGISNHARIARQNGARHKLQAEATRQAVRVQLVVLDELVQAMDERSVVEHVVGVDRVVDTIVVKVALVYQ